MGLKTTFMGFITTFKGSKNDFYGEVKRLLWGQ